MHQRVLQVVGAGGDYLHNLLVGGRCDGVLRSDPPSLSRVKRGKVFVPRSGLHIFPDCLTFVLYIQEEIEI